MSQPSEIKVKSLQKSLEILNCFIEKPSLGVTEISEKLGLYKSNAHNILSTFKAMNYLEQDEETGKYRLGDSIFYLCRALNARLTLSKLAMPYLQELVKLTGEVVYLAKPHEDEAVYLEALYPAESKISPRSVMGEREKMYCCSVGKAMLAHLPRDLQIQYASRHKVARTQFTLVDTAALMDEIVLTRDRGYAIDNMELEFGIKCVGVPVLNSNNEVEGGISVSGPSLRFDDEKIIEISKHLMRISREIQRKL